MEYLIFGKIKRIQVKGLILLLLGTVFKFLWTKYIHFIVIVEAFVVFIRNKFNFLFDSLNSRSFKRFLTLVGFRWCNLAYSQSIASKFSFDFTSDKKLPICNKS